MHDSTFVKAGIQGEKYTLTLTAIENNKNQFYTSNSKPLSCHGLFKSPTLLPFAYLVLLELLPSRYIALLFFLTKVACL